MYRYIENVSEIGSFLSVLPNAVEIGFDLETSGLDPFVNKVTLAQFNVSSNIYIFNVVKLGNGFLGYLVDLINNQLVQKVVIGHNIKFDLKFLKVHTGKLFTNVYDTMLAEGLIEKGLTKEYRPLKYVVQKYLDIPLDKSSQTSFIEDESGIFTDEQLEYAAKDVEYLSTIRTKQYEILLSQKQLDTLELETSVIPVFSEIELNGVRINQDKWLSLLGPAQESVKKATEAITEYFFSKVSTKKYSTALELMNALSIPVKTKRDQNKFQALGRETFKQILNENLNFSSSKQTVALLNMCGVNVDSSSEKNLIDYKDHEIIKLLLDYRENAKKVSTYGDKYFKHIHPVTGKIHTTLEQNESDSGRVASSSPCLTQIPNEVDSEGCPTYRGCIIPDEGYDYIDLDYAGQELRLAANILNEPKLKEAFQKGLDVHKLSASMMYNVPIEDVTKEQRYKGKTLNFGCLYGISAWGLHRNFGFNKDESKVLLENFWNGYSGMKKSINAIGIMIKKLWYSTTVNGRKRYFEPPNLFELGVEDYEKRVAGILREGVNHVIQGSAADVTKTALRYIYYRNPFGDNLKIVLSVHDEILCMSKKEISKDALEFVTSCMLEAEQQFLGEVPAKVDGGIFPYWGH